MEKTIYIEGMSCQHCVKAVEKELDKGGVEQYHVEIGKLRYEDGVEGISEALLKELIREAGYEPLEQELM